MSNLEKTIAEIDHELKLKGRDRETRRQLAMYAIQSLKLRLMRDNNLLNNDEIIKFYEYYFNEIAFKENN